MIRRKARPTWPNLTRTGLNLNVRGLLQAALAGLLLWGGQAAARTVKIITADTLELRNVDGQEIVIISGENVELRIDEDVVKAKRVEFNRTQRTLTLVGAATYHTAKDGQDLSGDNLVVDLGSEALTGQDVLISDANLEIRGSEVERVPGQLRAQGGYFTPCAKCGRTPNDYAFRAERLIVYPGDRLIAYRAQLLLADHPVLYLPIVVIPLNDRARQPRLSIGKDPVDGYTALADLPFSIGSSVLGTTMLRYYQNRSPSYGGGVDLHAYAPLRWVDRIDLYTLALPRPVYSRLGGYDADLNFSMKGRLSSQFTLSEPTYTLNVTRRDIGRSDADPERGVTYVDFAARADYPLFTAALYYSNRFGPDPTTTLGSVLKHPEVALTAKTFSVGRVNVDVGVVAGDYTAASNPNSRIASAAGLNYSTTRLQEYHNLSYTARPWRDAEVQLTNTFTGRYYGNGARTVQLSAAAQLTQNWAGGNSFSVRQEYVRNEGTSPFAFDVVSYRLSAPLTLRLNTVPVIGSTFTVQYNRDAFLPRGSDLRDEHLQVGGSVVRLPVNAYYGLDYNVATGDLDSGSFNVTVGDSNSNVLTLVPALDAVAATPTTPALPARPAYYRRSSAWPFPKATFTVSGSYSRLSGGLQPLNVRATFTGDTRTNTFSVFGTYAFQEDALQAGRNLTSVGLNYSAALTRDTVINPLSVVGNETLYLRYPRVSGTHSLTWRGYTLSTSHDLLLEQPDSFKESGNVTVSVGTVSGKATNWQLTYGGPYDLRRQAFTRPQLTGSLTTTQPGARLSAAAAVNLIGLDQFRTELAQASLDAAWQKGRYSLSGRATYQRTRSGLYPNDIATDVLTFDPLRVGVALGKGERPNLYLTASLRQTFTYVDGVRQNPTPFGPVIGLTYDRCCWAVQAEADFTLRRYRIAIGLPEQFYPLFQLDPNGASVPLLPFTTP